MARKRRESALENQVVSRTDDKPKEPKKKRLGAVVLAHTIKEGDLIAEKLDIFGVAKDITKVTSVEVGVRGCRNIHINRDKCYDGAIGQVIKVL